MVKSLTITNKPTKFSVVPVPVEYENNDHTYSVNETQVVSGQEVPSTSSTSTKKMADVTVGSGFFVGTDEFGNSYNLDPTELENQTLAVDVAAPEQGQFGAYYTPDLDSYKCYEQLRLQRLNIWDVEPRFLPYDHEQRLTEDSKSNNQLNPFGVGYVDPDQVEADDSDAVEDEFEASAGSNNYGADGNPVMEAIKQQWTNFMFTSSSSSSQTPTVSSSFFQKGGLEKMVGKTFQILGKEIAKLQVTSSALASLGVSEDQLQLLCPNLEMNQNANYGVGISEGLKELQKQGDEIIQLCKKIKAKKTGQKYDSDD